MHSIYIPAILKVLSVMKCIDFFLYADRDAYGFVFLYLFNIEYDLIL